MHIILVFLFFFFKAVRATLILIPLLGLHYLLIPFRPRQGTPEAAIYDVVSAAVASLQVSSNIRSTIGQCSTWECSVASIGFFWSSTQRIPQFSFLFFS